jgi:hypothetical protein
MPLTCSHVFRKHVKDAGSMLMRTPESIQIDCPYSQMPEEKNNKSHPENAKIIETQT